MPGTRTSGGGIQSKPGLITLSVFGYHEQPVRGFTAIAIQSWEDNHSTKIIGDL